MKHIDSIISLHQSRRPSAHGGWFRRALVPIFAGFGRDTLSLAHYSESREAFTEANHCLEAIYSLSNHCGRDDRVLLLCPGAVRTKDKHMQLGGGHAASQTEDVAHIH